MWADFEWRGSHGVVGRGREVAFVQIEDSRGRPLIEMWVLGAGAPCEGASTIGLWAGGFLLFVCLGEAVGHPPVLLRGQGQNPSDAWKRWALLCWLEWAKPEAGCAWDPGFLKQRSGWPLPFCEWKNWKSGFERAYPPSEQVGIGWFSKAFVSPGFLFVDAGKAKHFHYEF